MKTRYVLILPILLASAGQPLAQSPSMTLGDAAGSATDATLPPVPHQTRFTGVFLEEKSVSLPLVGTRKQALLLLRWDERERPLTVTVDNPSDSLVQVTGIQSSTGLYINKFPTVIPPRATAEVHVTYVTPKIERGVELIRLRTSAGEQDVLIKRHRESVIEVDGGVRWEVGEEAMAKSCSFSINTQAAGNLRPVSVRIPISGFSAALKPLGESRYAVEITPMSTAAPVKIPVILEFDPELPGSPVMLDAAIVKPGTPLGAKVAPFPGQ